MQSSSSGPLDELVRRLIIARLSMPDAAALLRPAQGSGIDVPALRRERAALPPRQGGHRSPRGRHAARSGIPPGQ